MNEIAKTRPDEHCQLCGHQCFARRSRGEKGRCGAGQLIGFSTALLHHGEEPPISGDGSEGGSGTIFFTRCVLRCVFCQNWQISQMQAGEDISIDTLAERMLRLQEDGALNINLVSPTPYAAQIAMALNLAKKAGLSIPIVYNSGGYDSLTALRLMEGLVDVYLPDAKIALPKNAKMEEPDPLSARLLGAGDYGVVNRRAIMEMFRQVGHLNLDSRGVAQKGLLVRHLVLPDNLARTTDFLPWLAENLGPKIHLSLMAQYHPSHLVKDDFNNEFRAFPGLSRPLSIREYEAAVDLAWECRLENTYIQGLAAATNYIPDFNAPKVFN